MDDVEILRTFTLKQIEKKYNIKSSTIRTWEDKYGLLVLPRDQENHRYLTHNDIDKILQIKQYRVEGHSIPTIKQLLEEEEDNRAAFKIDNENKKSTPVPYADSDQLETFLSTKLNEITIANQAFTRELLEKKINRYLEDQKQDVVKIQIRSEIIRNELRIEALKKWKEKPEEERYYINKRFFMTFYQEKTDDKEIFINQYIADNLPSKLEEDRFSDFDEME
ncbi:hypothetical protein DH09_01305 (plasmid) [Bacillaceae bacterium JMAK1]|nr:hypothetical protein DH09_01305 [Bacillaceae bacterium JMAK1]